MPRSFTFISALLKDNKILMEKDPSYLSNLKALSRVDRMRLLEGNWNVRAQSGNFFQRQWFEEVSAVPSGWQSVVRYWDRAATKLNESNKDPDWTRGVKLYKYPNGTWVVGDVVGTRDTPLNVEALIKATATRDGRGVVIYGEQDPGSAGVADAGAFTRMLQGYNVRINRPTKDKVTRAKPVSAQCEARNVRVVKGAWNDAFYSELENFPDGSHDDIVDAFSGAYNAQCEGLSIIDVL